MVASLGRVVLAIAALLGVYFQLPLTQNPHLGRGLLAVVVGLVVFGVIFVRQLRRIRGARYPVLRAVEAIALVATLFVVVVASVHFTLGQQDPSSYSEGLSRLDALYFTVTTLATVGYGDIAPTSDLTRTVTMIQMVMGVALLGVGIRILLSLAKMVAEKRQRDAA